MAVNTSSRLNRDWRNSVVELDRLDAIEGEGSVNFAHYNSLLKWINRKMMD
jgi:hypothetical protein